MTLQASEHPVCLPRSVTDRLRALPARYYVDREILEREREQIFFRSWQYACHVSELDAPGAFVAFEIMGQNLFVLRNSEGEIRAFYNVCPHRGHKLLEGAGRKKVIVCPYHQWSYSLDGNLRHDRSTASSETPQADSICLSPVRVDRLLDFVFVNLDPEAQPVADFWPGLEAHVKSIVPDLDSYSLSPGGSVLHPVDVRANWKIQVDNFLECYHCRIGHESFADMLDVANQKQALHPNYSYVFIPSSGKADNKAYPLLPEHDVMDLSSHLAARRGRGYRSRHGRAARTAHGLGPGRAAVRRHLVHGIGARGHVTTLLRTWLVHDRSCAATCLGAPIR